MSESDPDSPFAGEQAAATLRALMANAPEHLIVLDRGRRIIDVNYTNIHERSSVLGKRLDDFTREEDRPAMVAAVDHAFSTAEVGTFEATLEPPEGRRYYRNDVIPLAQSDPRWVLVRAVEITQHVEAQKALLNSEARYRSLTQHLPDFVVIIDRQRVYQWVNRVAPGLTMEQVLGAKVDDFVTPDTLQGTIAAIEEAFETGQPTEYVGRTGMVGDSPRWFLTRAVPMTEGDAADDGGERMLLLTADVTDQKLAELALRSSEQRLERALEAADIGLWEWTPTHDRIAVPALWARACGRPESEDEIPLERFYDSIHPDELGLVRRTLEQAASADAAAFELEYRVRSDDGQRERWLLHRGRVVGSDDAAEPPRVLGTLLDVTARREAERERMSLQEQLQRAQRLESIGQLAGGVAHDFNNLLLVVLSQTDLARRAVARGDDPTGALDEVQTASERAAELTRQLLTFSRKQGLSRTPVALGEHIAGLLDMLRRLLPENISLEYLHDEEDDTAAVDAGQIEQVILNLCLNARDAMPDGGRLVIETRAVELADADLQDHPTLAAGPYVAVRVRDTGTGIPAELRERMFEPFFTTKPSGQGTGLGLSVSEGIIKRHGGVIRVDSTPGEGTTFELLLPHSGRPATPRPAPPQPQPQPGTETVLVAEDEDMVRSLVAQILIEAGYHVIEARDGVEAVEKFEANASEISLVLLDAIMPNMGGRDAHERIAAIDPKARFLISSGYSDEQMPAGMLQRKHLEVLQKPYAPDDLLRAVRRVLDADPG